MDAKNLIPLTILAGVSIAGASLSGCGFKSDLSLPVPEVNPGALLAPDAPNDADVSQDKVIQEGVDSLTEVADEPILLDKVVEQASNAKILVDPSQASPEASPEASTESASTESASSAKARAAEEGVPVDLSDLSTTIEKKPETQ